MHASAANRAALIGFLPLSQRFARQPAPDGAGDGHGGDSGDAHSDKGRPRRRVSLVSIDMGLRNLAYAHLTAEVSSLGQESKRPDRGVQLDINGNEDGFDSVAAAVGKYEGTRSNSRSPCEVLSQIQLHDWRRLDIAALSSSSTCLDQAPSTTLSSTTSPPLSTKTMPPFDPAHLATQAHSLITTLIHRHNPTHILIERQRFRSGGGPAVQEWSIRVGVFEWVLWAVLKALGARVEQLHAVGGSELKSGKTEEDRSGKASRRDDGGIANRISVHAAQPTRVNRYWMERGRGSDPDYGAEADTVDIMDMLSAGSPEQKATRRTSHRVKEELQGEVADTEKRAPTGRDLKRAKIDSVGGMLSEVTAATAPTSPTPFTIHPSATSTARSFLSAWNARNGKARTPKGQDPYAKIDKLDDLADCLLQGLAWIRWSNNIAKLEGVMDGLEVGKGEGDGEVKEEMVNKEVITRERKRV